MKKYYFYLAFFIFLILICCKKEKPANNPCNDNVIVDSIPLKYIELSPNAYYVDVDGDGSNDIIISDTNWIAYSGPHPYPCYLTRIKSINLKFQISPGRLSDGSSGYLYSFNKDSIVDASSWWHDNYVCDGWVLPGGTAGAKSEYVGVKKVENSNIYYGWLHKPSNHNPANSITEFAIDTSNFIQRNVLAGGKKK